MKNSIRVQLTVTLLASLGLLMVLGVGVLSVLVEHSLLAQFDAGLRSKIRLLTMFPEVDQEGIDLEFTERHMPEFETPERGEYYQLWLRDGTILAKSKSLGSFSFETHYGTLDHPVFWNVTLRNGRRIRAAGVGFLPISDEVSITDPKTGKSRFGMVLVFARDRAVLDRLLVQVRWGIIAIGVLMLALTALVVDKALRKGLAPVKHLAQEVERLEASSLASARISSEALPGELIPIATELNLLIERLNEAFQRERRLTSDIAHEINTPLSELRAASEVALKWPDDPEATQQLAQQTLEIVTNLQQVTQALLELARQQSASATEKQHVNMAALWKEIRELHASVARERNLAVQEDLPPDLTAETNPILLRMILNNLLENALHYSPDGAIISCRLSAKPDGTWRFCIENPNTSLTNDDLGRLFDPLWRKETSRTDSHHSGLGLTLARMAAERLGLFIQANLPAPGSFCICVHSSRG